MDKNRIKRFQFRSLHELGESENGMFVPSEEIFNFEDAETIGKEDEVPQQQEQMEELQKEVKEPSFSAAEVEAMKEEAYIQGKQEGKQEGKKEAEKKFNQTTQALAKALEEISSLRWSILNNSKYDSVRLIMIIVSQVIKVEVAEKENIILQAVERALQAAVQSEEYRIKINPEDWAVITANKHLFVASMSGLKNIIFESDDQVGRGGCIVESDKGMVDARIETQLEKIQEYLWASVSNEQE